MTLDEIKTAQQEVLAKLAKVDKLHETIATAKIVLNERKQGLQKLDKILDDKLGQLRNIGSDIEKIINEKTEGFPWLAKVISDYFYMKSKKIADSVQYKKHPAVRSAEVIRGEALKRREAEKKYRITKYLLEYYESLFPWLVDFKGEDLDDYIESHLHKPKPDDTTDPVMFYLSRGEWEKLTVSERNQRALDRYWTRKKPKWVIGRDYERYIGYLYEKDGYSVYYQGIIEGFYDLGRDLIAKKGNETCIIQCKCWSQEKTIHEKHIMMLYGTVVEYAIKNKTSTMRDLFSQEIDLSKIKGIFTTSTQLSNIARDFAKTLKIECKESFPLAAYPSIKCNVSRPTGEKIYHLPMDQQYDTTLIEKERNECYVKTVAEAEKFGFRRAWRWRGEKEELAPK